jgi:IS5 family transposase
LPTRTRQRAEGNTHCDFDARTRSAKHVFGVGGEANTRSRRFGFTFREVNHLAIPQYLSGSRVEEALYESAALRRFVGVDLGVAPAPDETTVCRFRHLLEKHALGGLMLEVVNVHLEDKGIRIATGTIVDATIIHAPCSTKNQSGERDPEMHQTRKGKQWYFGFDKVRYRGIAKNVTRARGSRPSGP